MEKEKLIRLTGLWQGTNKEGKMYISGYLGDARVLIFANNFKEKETQPDFIMYLADKKKEEGAKAETQTSLPVDPNFVPF